MTKPNLTVDQGSGKFRGKKHSCTLEPHYGAIAPWDAFGIYRALQTRESKTLVAIVVSD